MEIKLPIYVSISDNIISTENDSLCRGQFEYNHEQNFYELSKMDDKNGLVVYIYRLSDNDWIIGPSLNVEQGWLHNMHKTKVVPSLGWQMIDISNKVWVIKNNLL